MRKSFGPNHAAATAVGAGIAFYVGDMGSAFVRSQLEQGAQPSTWLSHVDAWFTAQPAPFSTQQTDLIVGAVAAFLILLIVLYRFSDQTNKRPGEEQGSAAWSTSADIRPFTDTDPTRRLQFTQSEALSLDTQKTQRNLNVLVIGASGTGKTRGYLMPNLSRVAMSAAVTDPKGEIYRGYADALRARGNKVRTLNLIDLKNSGKFNPLRYFSETEPETSVAQLTECIITNTSDSKSSGGSDGFWERAERALLTALVAYEWATARAYEREPNLPGVVDLQKRMQGSEENPDELSSETDENFQVAREAVAEWKQDATEDPSLLDDPVMKMLDFAGRQYRIYEQGPAETRMSVVISLGVRLAPLDMHDVRALLESDDLELDRLGYEPTTLFLQIPDSHATFRFIASMFWQSLFEKTVYQADHEATGRLPIPVHAFLDEFANIGKIPNFEILMATIRSRGISASIIVQSYTQGKAIWDKAWDTIAANCDSKLFLGGMDLDTNKWLSSLLGDETITAENTSRNYGANGSYSRSQTIMKRALMTPDELGVMSNDLAILLVRGLRPFKSRKVSLRG